MKFISCRTLKEFAIYRLSINDKELVSIEEKQQASNVAVNGIDTLVERPRSPSPTSLNELPIYSNDTNSFLSSRTSFAGQNTYSLPSVNENLMTNVSNEIGYSVNNDDKQQISQILKEANALSAFSVNHFQPFQENKSANVKVCINLVYYLSGLLKKLFYR